MPAICRLKQEQAPSALAAEGSCHDRGFHDNSERASFQDIIETASQLSAYVDACSRRSFHVPGRISTHQFATYLARAQLFLVNTITLGTLEYLAIVTNIRPSCLRRSLLDKKVGNCDMAPFTNHYTKARARSFQLDAQPGIIESVSPPPLSSGDKSKTPAPSSRSVSVALPSRSENQEPSTIRHYRSMLVVDAPRLAPLAPVCFDEILVSSTSLGTCIPRPPNDRSCFLLTLLLL